MLQPRDLDALVGLDVGAQAHAGFARKREHALAVAAHAREVHQQRRRGQAGEGRHGVAIITHRDHVARRLVLAQAEQARVTELVSLSCPRTSKVCTREQAPRPQLLGFGRRLRRRAPTRAWRTRSGVGGEALHEWLVRHAHVPADVRQGGRHDRRRRRLRRARLREHRRVDHGPQHVRPGARAVARRQHGRAGGATTRPTTAPSSCSPTTPRAPIAMEGGTTFHFVTDGIHAALERAAEAAGDKDVRIGGGVATIRQYLRRRADRRAAPRHLAGAARLRRTPPRRHRPAAARLPVRGARRHVRPRRTSCSARNASLRRLPPSPPPPAAGARDNWPGYRPNDSRDPSSSPSATLWIACERKPLT